MFQLMPVITLMRRAWVRDLSENDILSTFAHKIISVCRHDTIRIFYVMVDLLRFVPVSEVTALTIRSMGYLLRMIELVGRVSC